MNIYTYTNISRKKNIQQSHHMLER